MNIPESFEFESRCGRVRTKYMQYKNGRLAILLVSAERNEMFDVDVGDEVGKLTVNIPAEDLKDGEFFVKNWTENVDLAAGAMASGKFVDTRRRVRSGHVDVPVWRFS